MSKIIAWRKTPDEESPCVFQVLTVWSSAYSRNPEQRQMHMLVAGGANLSMTFKIICYIPVSYLFLAITKENWWVWVILKLVKKHLPGFLRNLGTLTSTLVAAQGPHPSIPGSCWSASLWWWMVGDSGPWPTSQYVGNQSRELVLEGRREKQWRAAPVACVWGRLRENPARAKAWLRGVWRSQAEGRARVAVWRELCSSAVSAGPRVCPLVLSKVQPLVSAHSREGAGWGTPGPASGLHRKFLPWEALSAWSRCDLTWRTCDL